MRARISSLLLLAILCQGAIRNSPNPPRPFFHVAGRDPGWQNLLASLGLLPASIGTAGVLILKPGTPASEDWRARAESGSILVFEGESPAAESFGYRGSAERVRIARISDTASPSLEIVWERPVDLPRFQTPEEAHVFAWETETRAPVIAGECIGSGAVLWVITSPGEEGYERFPYLPQALVSLGVKLPARANDIWAFFDASYRRRVDLNYFAARWRQSGISALHVAAWQFLEPDPEQDLYLTNLIQACHRHGVLVYAWLELPHVSERFWQEHPEWREQTAVLQDAHLDWRKLMNLANPDCSRAVSQAIRPLISRFNWDGVNLAELYFESLEGPANPSRFTPMNADIRAGFRSLHGFDPIELFGAPSGEKGLRAFLDYRAGLARRLQTDWLAEAVSYRDIRPDLDVVLTHIDDRYDTRMRDALGADAAGILPLLERQDFTFLIEDPATVWHLGPGRYSEIASRYTALTQRRDKLAIDLNVVERYQDVYPTRQQTGSELFQMVHGAAASFARVALYFENSLARADLPLLAAAAAPIRDYSIERTQVTVEFTRPAGLIWDGAAIVDGKLWPVSGNQVVWLPAGRHTVGSARALPPFRVIDFNGELESAEFQSGGAIQIGYQGSSRAIAIVDRKPSRVLVDGRALPGDILQTEGGWVVLLPRGRHLAIFEP